VIPKRRQGVLGGQERKRVSFFQFTFSDILIVMRYDIEDIIFCLFSLRLVDPPLTLVVG